MASHDPSDNSEKGENRSGNWDAINEAEQQSQSDQSLSVIGSLVSYSINYMEKHSKLGKQLGVLAETDRASDSDNSLMVEKESQERQSSPEEDESIDTIEEEVDLSQSEGSDHEPANID